MDVNVAAQRTDPLLFEWADVLALRRSERNGPRPPSETFELRVVEASDAVRASALSSFRAPLDVAGDRGRGRPGRARPPEPPRRLVFFFFFFFGVVVRGCGFL